MKKKKIFLIAVLGFLALGAALYVEHDAACLIVSSVQTAQGTDVASADEITLSEHGNYFDITGTTDINHITKTGWQAGSVVILQFDGSLDVVHDSGSPVGTEASILLSGAGDFSATADDTLQLVYDGTTFREVSRTVI